MAHICSGFWLCLFPSPFFSSVRSLTYHILLAKKKNAFSPSRYLKIPLLCIKTWYDYRFCFGISTLRLDNLTETRGEYSLILIYRVVLNIVWLLAVFTAPRQCDFTTLMERVLLLALAFVLPMDTFNFEISWHDEEADPFKVRTNWIIL